MGPQTSPTAILLPPRSGSPWASSPSSGPSLCPFSKRCTGGTGDRSVLQRQPLQVSSCDRLEDSLLVTGFAYDRHTRLDNNYAEFCWFTHRTHGVRRGGAAAWTWPLWPLAARTATGNGACLLGSGGWRGVGGSGRWNRHRLWQSTLRPLQWPGRCRWRQPACGDHRRAVSGATTAWSRFRCARGHGHGILRRGREDVRWRCNLQLAQRI